MLRNDLYIPWFAGKEDWGIEIISGEFKNTVMQIKEVELTDEGVQLEYHIVKAPDIDNFDSNSSLFVNVVELIINDVLKEAINDYEQNRNNDPQEPSSQ